LPQRQFFLVSPYQLPRRRLSPSCRYLPPSKVQGTSQPSQKTFYCGDPTIPAAWALAWGLKLSGGRIVEARPKRDYLDITKTVLTFTRTTSAFSGPSIRCWVPLHLMTASH